MRCGAPCGTILRPHGVSAHHGASTPAGSGFQARFWDSFPEDGHECPKDELELASSDPEVASSAFNCASSGPEPASSAFNYASSDPELATSVSQCVPSLSTFAHYRPERARSGRFLRTRRCRIAVTLHGSQTAYLGHEPLRLAEARSGARVCDPQQGRIPFRPSSPDGREVGDRVESVPTGLGLGRGDVGSRAPEA